MSKDNILSHKLFLAQEESNFHLPYDGEMDFYEAVKNGNFERVKETMKPLATEGMGKLSSHPIRNLKYHLVITIALITRFCIEGGLPTETAYTLSDIYIQQLDTMNDEDSIKQLHQELIYDFATRMQSIKKKIGLSRTVIRATEYIYNHLNEKILLDDLSEYLDVNKSYLCELFKKETGITISSYVIKLKVEAAQKMLESSNYEASDIANYFCFSSHSHFIATFKKYTGMTPNEYRNFKYRNHF